MNHKITEIATNSHSPLNCIGEVVVYDWNAKFANVQLKEFLNDWMEALFDSGFSFEAVVNGEFTGAQLYDLGFKVWDKFDDGDLWLIPVYMFNHIPKGTKLVTILGETEEFDQEKAEADTRFGCISYGFVLPKERKQELDDFVKFRKNEISQEKTEKVAPHLCKLLDCIEPFIDAPKKDRKRLHKAIDEALDEMAERRKKS